MYRLITSLSTLAVLLAAPVAARAQDTTHTPITPKTVGQSVTGESKRVANRTGKAVRKGAKQTEKQAKRTTKSLERAVSRKKRMEAKGDTLPKKP